MLRSALDLPSSATWPKCRALLSCAAGLAMLLLGACGGDDPFAMDWAADIDTVTLFSLARPELNLESAYDFSNRLKVVVEEAMATGSWDMAVDDDGESVFILAPGALGVDSRAGLAPMPGITFDGLTEAPRDTSLYIRDRRIAVQPGDVFAVRTRELPGLFGETCVFFGKLEVLETDLEERTLRYFLESSPVCNDRNLVPTIQSSTPTS
ncbi:MAG: hypothetical protein RQ745_00855 [Longimicrobiales bacterium]|nr:hypothetical protein [Longimicrobiales bacterium]